ncbi:major strawberry allergen Fra a 1.08-like [Aristolochia californica]|uniref:major strawberry allergen Fra a 1.08-like n=1 Tax=Aristolochia californica TaxID=171875 RepID=UPI0035E096D8
MVVGIIRNKIVSIVPAPRLWNALVKDSPSIMPKILSEVISKIEVLEGDGGICTIVHTNFKPGTTEKELRYWKHRVDTLDDENFVFHYYIIEEGRIGKKVKSTWFELKFK